MTINIQEPNQDARETWLRLKEKLGLIPPKPVGPTYKSESKGLIAISSMHYNHRVAAAKKLLLKVIDAMREDVETLAQLEEFHEFVLSLPMEDDERETLKNLTTVYVNNTTKAVDNVVPKPKLLNVFNNLHGTQ